MAISPPYRVYIDESGDHTYRQLDKLDKRYLALTGVVIQKSLYNPAIPNSLEALKKRVFTYDIDCPPILTRQEIRSRKGPFGVLKQDEKNAQWESEILAFYEALPAQIFTVTIDKKAHYEEYADASWNPYSYSLDVLLSRIRGWLAIKNSTADVMPESRGNEEDAQLLSAYRRLRQYGSTFMRADHYSGAFPNNDLLFAKKSSNVAGLQLADLIAAEQKLLTVEEHLQDMPHKIYPFGKKLNAAIEDKVNHYGRYLLQ